MRSISTLQWDWESPWTCSLLNVPTSHNTIPAWSRDVVSLNILSLSATCVTFHLDRPWLKDVALQYWTYHHSRAWLCPCSSWTSPGWKIWHHRTSLPYWWLGTHPTRQFPPQSAEEQLATDYRSRSAHMSIAALRSSLFCGWKSQVSDMDPEDSLNIDVLLAFE